MKSHSSWRDRLMEYSWQFRGSATLHYETRLRRIPNRLYQRLAKCPRMDRSLGRRMGVLPALRQCKNFVVPKQQPAGGFLLPLLQRRVRTQEPERKIWTRVVDGAFKTKCERLAASNNPNLFLMNYDLKSLAVVNLFIVPKHFFVREIIEERKPLAATARRAGWIGSNILLSRVPESGKIHIVQNGVVRPRSWSLRNGRRRFSSEMNHRKRAAGCSMS